MAEIPVVSYRFHDSYWVTDFITPKNPDIQDVVARLGNVEGDKFVEAVAAYIRDNYQYPLWNGNPTCDGQLLRYTQGVLKHGFKCCMYYVWAFPPEVIQSKLGYCAETGNLAESLLVNKVNSFAVLGDVLSLNGALLGRHEWLETPYKGETYVLETTIHTQGANTLATTKSVYDKNSDWAKQGGLYYSPQARFNDKIYEGSNEFIVLMKLPVKRILRFGFDETLKENPKRLHKELRKEQAAMQKLLKQAWGA
jgi:hypothetical protein